jgi:hypothetical protein
MADSCALLFQVEEVSKHGLTKQNERKNDGNDDAEMEEPFSIRHEFDWPELALETGTKAGSEGVYFFTDLIPIRAHSLNSLHLNEISATFLNI